MKLCFLIGNPVEHSLSPGMHRIIYDELGLGDWEYKLRNIKDETELRNFIAEVKEKGYTGFNVTVPYKQIIMNYLDDVGAKAKIMGAVNTVKNNNGRLEGYNTDWLGFKNDLKDSLNFEAKGKSALVLGAGGAARAVVGGLNSEKISKVFIYDIDKSKMNSVKNEFCDVEIVEIEKEDIDSKLNEVDLLVNTTPVGMNENDPAVISLKGKNFKEGFKVYDVIYNRKTRLLKEAEELGLDAAGGIGMLVGQGIEAFSLWAPGKVVSKEVIEKMKEHLRREVNKR